MSPKSPMRRIVSVIQAETSLTGWRNLVDTLERLLESPTGHNELQSRVWKLIDSITENTPESERLRKEVFDRTGDAACCDRAAFTFAN